jgi:hypothetical protein
MVLLSVLLLSPHAEFFSFNLLFARSCSQSIIAMDNFERQEDRETSNSPQFRCGSFYDDSR